MGGPNWVDNFEAMIAPQQLCVCVCVRVCSGTGGV